MLLVAKAMFNGDHAALYPMAQHHRGPGPAARRFQIYFIAIFQFQTRRIVGMHGNRVVGMDAAQAPCADAVGVLQRRFKADQFERPLAGRVGFAHRRAVGKRRHAPGGRAGETLAAQAVLAHAQALVVQHHRFQIAVRGPVLRIRRLIKHRHGRRRRLGIRRRRQAQAEHLAIALVAPSARQHEGHLAPLFRLQGALQFGADARHARERNVVVAGLRHGRLALPGDVGAAAQIPVFRAQQGEALAIHVLQGLRAEARQGHRFGQRDEERFHADGLAIRRFLHARFDHGPARRAHFDGHAAPGAGPAPAFIQQGIGQQVVGKRRAFIDEGVDGDDQGNLLRIGQLLADLRAQARDAVDRIAAPQDQRLQGVRIAVHGAGEPFGRQRGRVRIPRRPGRIRLARFLLQLEFRGFFIGHIAPDRHARRLDLAVETLEVIARPRPRILEAAAIDQGAALAVQVADQGIEHDQRIRVIKTGARHHAAVRIDGGALAMAGEFLRQAFDDVAPDAAGSRVFIHAVALRFFVQHRHGRLQVQRRARHFQRTVEEQAPLALGRGVRHDRLRGGVDHAKGVAILVALFFRQLHRADVRRAQVAAVARMAFLVDDQMRGIAPGGLARRFRHLQVRLREEVAVIAFVLDDPADHGHGQRAIRARLDRYPAAAVARCQAVGIRQHRVDDDVAEIALARSRFRDQRALALERIARIARRRAHKNAEFRIFQVHFRMRHFLHVAEHGARAAAIGAAAIRTVVDQVQTAVRLLEEARAERQAAIVRAAHQAHLVDLRAQFRLRRIDRFFQLAQGAQALHVAFAKQVAAFRHFLHQLIEGDRLPLAAAARSHALHGRQHAERRLHLFQHAIAAAASGRAPFQAFFLEARERHKTVAYRGLVRQRRIGRHGAVGIARHAQHLAAFFIQAHAHAAKRGAAHAHGVADLLVRIDGQFSRGRVDGKLGRQGIAVQALYGFVLAQRVVDHAAGRGGKAGGKGGQAAADGAVAQQLAALFVFIFRDVVAVVVVCVFVHF